MGVLFNDKHIFGLKPREKAYYVKEVQAWRGGGRLTVKVCPNETKEFYIIYYISGKRKQLKIGTYGKALHGKTTLAEARIKFSEYSKQVSEGHDPKELKKEKEVVITLEKVKQKSQGSIHQLVDCYTEYLGHKRSFNYANEVKRALRKDFLPFVTDTKKANEIVTDDVLEALHIVSDRGSLSHCNKLRTYILGMFNYGLKFDYSTDSKKKGTKFFLDFNPVLKIPKIEGVDTPLDRYLSEEELKQLWSILEFTEMEVTKVSIYKILLLLGTRVEETAGGLWKEISFSERIWLIPASRTKNKKANLLPLSDTAISILKNIKSFELQSPYIFYSFETEKHFTADSINQSLSRLLKQHGIVHYTPRDLRRTFKTLTGKAGIAKDIRDRIQNHALNDVSSVHYDLYDYLPEKRKALETWEKYLLNIIE